MCQYKWWNFICVISKFLFNLSASGSAIPKENASGAPMKMLTSPHSAAYGNSAQPRRDDCFYDADGVDHYCEDGTHCCGTNVDNAYCCYYANTCCPGGSGCC